MLRKMSASTINVARNLKQVQEKIRAASAKRPQHLQYTEPRLVAVSKTKGVEYIFDAYDGGQRHFGENYINEIHEKANDIELQDRCDEIKWHFIGHLQRNKISKILDIPNLYVIESVDSERLAKSLDEAWARYNKSGQLNVMVQCNTSGEENKNGCPPSEAAGFVKYVRENCSNLNFLGVMTIGIYDYDLSNGPNPDFQIMLSIRENVSKELGIPIESIELSMGMSGDFEHAVEVGSTNVRVGTTIFGARSKRVTSDSAAAGDGAKEADGDKTSNNSEGGKSDASHSTCQASSSVDGHIEKRLSGVKGYGEKVNEVFVCGNVKNCTEHIIFFGGDVQDFPERMMVHQDNKRYAEWNLEATSLKILRKFPHALVMTVRPMAMHLMTYSVYANFLEFEDNCKPMHCEDHGAWLHLHHLYNSVLNEVNFFGVNDDIDNQNPCPLRIIGFSKGCVVLNQLVFELHLMDKNDKLKRFINQFKSMHWLDGGHAGGPENTWITHDEQLKRLAKLSCDIFIDVTPYQMKDSNRDWVGKQEAKFYKKLKKLKANVKQSTHFDSEPNSIENHFNVLEEFNFT